jgi:hypothetical protein
LVGEIVLLIATGAFASEATSLREVRAVYVGSFGNAQGADLIREKVINRLVKSGKVSVVQEPESADAILIGVAEIVRDLRYSASVDQYGGAASGGTRYDATLVVRLIGKGKKILWRTTRAINPAASSRARRCSLIQSASSPSAVYKGIRWFTQTHLEWEILRERVSRASRRSGGVRVCFERPRPPLGERFPSVLPHR